MAINSTNSAPLVMVIKSALAGKGCYSTHYIHVFSTVAPFFLVGCRLPEVLNDICSNASKPTSGLLVHRNTQASSSDFVPEIRCSLAGKHGRDPGVLHVGSQPTAPFNPHSRR